MNQAPRASNLRIVTMAEKHLDQVMAIEEASFAHPWTRNLFAAEIKSPLAMPLAAVSGASGLVKGYICLWLVADEVQIQNIAVRDSARREGVARALLMVGLGLARKSGANTATLEVRPSNIPARRLYASLGFVTQGVRPNYYAQDGEDAILMAMDLILLD